jgi:uncharacterized protein (DUF3084 family)
MELYATMQKLQNEIEELKVTVKDKDKLLRQLALRDEEFQTVKAENKDLKAMIKKRDADLHATTVQIMKRDAEIEVLQKEKDLEIYESRLWKKFCKDIITQLQDGTFLSSISQPACP